VFRKHSEIPIEERDYSPYYIVFSGLLFLGTMWAVVDEVSTRRPWKDYQKEYYDLLRSRATEQLDYARSIIDSTALLDVQHQLKASQDSLAGSTYKSAYALHYGTLEKLAEATREFQFAKSRSDEAYYFYKKSMLEGREDLEEKKKLEENEAVMASYQAQITALQQRRDSLGAILDAYRQAVRTAQNSIDEILNGAKKWELKLTRLDAATIEIKQVMMLDYDRNPFNDPKARVDRCQTCHLGWNEEVMEDAPQPFTKHPPTELLTTHNPEVFGCTPCHRGQGPALTAGFAHGDEDHYWENPLLKGKNVWASCNECHENQSSLKHAPEFTKAKQLMIESGCHGCHEIAGYTDLAKIGPELNRIGHKTTPEWVFRWVKNPKDYNPHTRMPNFLFNDEQAEAIAAFLMSINRKSTYSPGTVEWRGGNPDRGKKVVETVGCLACHVVGEHVQVREERGTSYDIAPELTRVGSKVKADWLYDWVKNPRHYNPTTKMPNMRLTDQEAKDVVAYLMGLKDASSPEVPRLDMISEQRIRRGEKLVKEYGCYGCHAIEGTEKESRVSVSLSNFGRKKVDEFDFGDTKVPHTWHDWVFSKLRHSRVFATDRIEQKMPVFSFTDEEIERLRIFLLAQTKDKPDMRYVQMFDKQQQDIETGRRMAYNYNCQQCHQLEERGGYIGAILEDAAFMPPPITGEGKKVQEEWLHDFLRSPTPVGKRNSIRPWIEVRMPTFGFSEMEISNLMKYFLGLSNLDLEIRDYASFQPDPELVSIGKMIFDDFQCAKCHPTGDYVPKEGEVSTQDLAPDLTKARGRLKPEWIVAWLADPGKIQQGTRMPTFFPDGQSPLPDVLGGDANRQMVAIRDYLMTIGRPPRPVGAMP
jgi:cytochrome c2